MKLKNALKQKIFESEIVENELEKQIGDILKRSLTIEVAGGDYGSGYYVKLLYNGNEIASDSLPYSSR